MQASMFFAQRKVNMCLLILVVYALCAQIGDGMKQITDKEFLNLVNYVKSNFGVNLIHKRTLVVGRLSNYLEENNFLSLTDYLKHIMSDKSGKAATEMINRLTTNHTYFMRENRHFEIFKNQVLPFLERTHSGSKDLSIWSAGCSSGEEPYTLAMIISDYFGINKSKWDTKILATDISTKALAKAVEGVYTKEDISALPDNWRNNNFVSMSDGRYKICEKISKEIIFRRFNLMMDRFPFKRKFDVIFCRNVMIYFDSATKCQIVNKFYESTQEGGYLFIGHSESLNREETKYRCIMPAVYRK